MGSDQLDLIRQRRQLAQIAERRQAAQGGAPPKSVGYNPVEDQPLDVTINPTGQAQPPGSNGYSIGADIAERGVGPVAWEQLNLGGESLMHGLGHGISQLSDMPGRAAALINGQEFNPEWEHQQGPWRALNALGQWLSDSPSGVPAERKNVLSGTVPEMAGASAPMLLSALAGPEGPVAMGGLQSAAGGLEQGQEAQAAAKAAGQPGPTDLQVALHTLISGGLGAAGGKALSLGMGTGSLVGAAAVPGAVGSLQSQLTGESAHQLLGAERPSSGTNLEAGAAMALLGAAGHVVNPHPVQPNTTPGKVEVVSDPAAIENGVTEEVAKLPFREAPADPRVSEAPKPTESVERTEPVALKEILPTADDAKEIGDWSDTWIADRDQAQVNARLTASRHEGELKAAVPPEPFSEMVRRVAATGQRQSPAFTDTAYAGLMYIDTRGKAAEEFQKYGQYLSPDDRRIFELSQNLPPEVQKIADTIADENTAQGETAKEAGVVEEYNDSYVARIWKPIDEGGFPPEGVAKFTTTSGRLRARTYSSILQGLAEGRELAVPSMIDAQRIASEQVHQVIADRKLLELGLQSKLFSRDQEPGYEQVQHPNFRARTWVRDVPEGGEAGPLGPGLYEKDGKVFQKQPVYAPKEVADRLNRALGTSGIAGVRGVKSATAVNNLMKQSMLLYSFFHHIAMTTAYTLGNPTSAKNLDLVGGYRAGNEALKYPSANLNELVRAGMTVGRAQDYEAVQLAERTRLEQTIDALPVVAQTKNVLKAIRDQQHDFLFHRFMPALKTQAANLEFNKALQRNKQALLDGTITRDEIARGVAVTMNNRFQSQNLMRLDRSPTTQHIFRLAALAPDWTESIARFTAQGFKPGFEGELARRTWARILFKGAIATQTANLIMAGFDDRTYWERIKDAYNSKDGAIGGALRAVYNVDVSPLYKKLSGADEAHKYISIVNQYSLPFELMEKGPMDVARGRTSPLARAAWDATSGTDWAGKPITTLGELFGIDNKGVYSALGKGPNGVHLPGEDKGGKLAGQTASYQSESQGGPIGWQQAPSWAMQEGLGVLPLEIQNTIGWLSGQHDGWDAALKSLGFRATSSDPEGVLKRMLKDDADHAQSLGEKRAAEMRLKAFNKQLQIKKLGGH